MGHRGCRGWRDGGRRGWSDRKADGRRQPSSVLCSGPCTQCSQVHPFLRIIRAKQPPLDIAIQKSSAQPRQDVNNKLYAGTPGEERRRDVQSDKAVTRREESRGTSATKGMSARLSFRLGGYWTTPALLLHKRHHDSVTCYQIANATDR